MGKASSPLRHCHQELAGMGGPTRTTHLRRPKQAKKAKREPIKVVIIPNPMRVEASAAEFQALVQRLTGRESDNPSAPEFPPLEPIHDLSVPPYLFPGADSRVDLYRSAAGDPFDMFDDEAFVARMLEDCLPSAMSSPFYEPSAGAFGAA